jgi:hypothetical protein
LQLLGITFGYHVPPPLNKSTAIILEYCKIFCTCFRWRIASLAALSLCTFIVLAHPIYRSIPNIYRLASTTTAVICPSRDSYISKRTSPNRRHYIHLSTPSSSFSFYPFLTSIVWVCSFYSSLDSCPVTCHHSCINQWPLHLISGNIQTRKSS